MKYVPDVLVNLVVIKWDGRAGSFLTKTEPVPAEDAEVARILRAFPMIGTWDDAFLMADCALKRMNCQMDLRSFAYHRDEPVVDISDGAFDYISMSEAAFQQLLLRLFDALISGAKQTQAAILNDPDWAQFTEDVAQLRARAGQ